MNDFPVRADRKLRQHIEHAIQKGVFQWHDLWKKRLPELELLYAIPNGAAVRGAKRRAADGKVKRFSPAGARLKAEGLKAGMPDVHWPVARGRYHGLWIEHKVPEGAGPNEDQVRKMAALRAAGHLCVVSRSADYTMNAILTYWNLGLFAASAPACEIPDQPKKPKAKKLRAATAVERAGVRRAVDPDLPPLPPVPSTPSF